MDPTLGVILFLAVVAWIVYQVMQGFNDENAPKKVQMMDLGGGVREPVCITCKTRLVPVYRDARSGASSMLSVLVGLVGVIVILFNWMLGGIALIIAILIAIVGKKKQTVLTCPSCGQDAKVLG